MADAHLRIMTVSDAINIAKSGAFEDTGIQVWVKADLPNNASGDRSVANAFSKVRSTIKNKGQNEKEGRQGMKIKGRAEDWGTQRMLPQTLMELATRIEDGETIYADFRRERVTHIHAENVPYTCVRNTFWSFHGARSTVMQYGEPNWQRVVAVLHLKKERWDHWMLVGDRSDDWLIANARGKIKNKPVWTREGGTLRQSIRSDELSQRTPSSASAILEQIGRNLNTYIATPAYLTAHGLESSGIHSKMMTGIGCSPQIYNANMISNGGLKISTHDQSGRNYHDQIGTTSTITRINN